MTKKIWRFDPQTKEFLKEDNAKESPMEPGVFLVPANATDIKPPKKKSDETLIFDIKKNNWVIIPDYRNQIVFSKKTGDEKLITELGPLPEEFTTKKRPNSHFIWDPFKNEWVEDSTLSNQSKLEKNKELYLSRKNSPIEFEDHTFNREIITEVLLLIELDIQESILLDKDLEPVKFNIEKLKKFAKKFIDQNQKLNKTFVAKKRKIEEA